MKKINKRKATFIVTTSVVIASICAPVFLKDEPVLSPVNAVADESETPFAWNDDNKELAWACYYSTEWDKLGKFMFDGDGSFSEFKFNDFVHTDMLTGLGLIVDEALKQVDNPKDGKSKSEYRNLLLAMCFAAGMDGSTYKTEVKDVSEDAKKIYALNDLSYRLRTYYMHSDYYTKTDDMMFVDNRSDSKEVAAVVLMYNNLNEAMAKYNSKYEDEVNIYRTDDALFTCVQAAIYGPDFVEYTNEYTKGKAKLYFNSHKQLKKNYYWCKFADFAKVVSERYSAVESTGHEVIG